MSSYNSNSGFTLVELLIGLVLSLFIIAVALTYMIASAQTFRLQTNDSIIQENARFALEKMTENIRLAGLNSDNNFQNKMQVIYSANICPAGEAGAATGAAGGAVACTKDGANDATDNNSDRFAIDYVVRRPTTTCNGTNITATDISNVGGQLRLASVFWTGDNDANDTVRSLYCQTYRLNDRTALGAAQPLVEGIERMQVQYGVDNDGDGLIDRYQSFTNLGAGNSDDVKAVRVALLISSGIGIAQTANSEAAVSRSFTLLDAPVTTINDSVARQIFSTTVLIPNGL